MLKRIARVIENPKGYQGFEPHPESMVKARAVIEALREPTVEMQSVGSEIARGSFPGADQSKLIWQTMLDVELKEA